MTKIKSIRKFSQPTKVYDISVEDNHNFFAEGILVHNCSYRCQYCFANSFRASLYTAFFDNARSMGLRHCNPTYYKQELDKMLKYRVMNTDEIQSLNGINKAFALNMPVRLGIRFEDFLKAEAVAGISLEMLRYMRDISYPVMINTKSDLVGTEPYVRALADNKAHSAVHVTVISNNETLLKKLEPGAPTYAARLQAIKNLCAAGVRVVARIEPYLYLLNDNIDEVNQYMEDMWSAGVRNITFDTYSYTAGNSGLRQNFINAGYDYDRMYVTGCDSQPLGSLLLGSFIALFRARGFSCSTFDIGNSAKNNQNVCCEVEDWFVGAGWNYGCTVMAARYVISLQGRHVAWHSFEAYVQRHGGFLTEALRQEVKQLWNLGGNVAYSHRWAAGLTPVGRDEDGLIWTYEPSQDYREDILKSLI